MIYYLDFVGDSISEVVQRARAVFAADTEAKVVNVETITEYKIRVWFLK